MIVNHLTYDREPKAGAVRFTRTHKGIEERPTDRSFAQLLTSAGLSSINFSQQVTTEDFGTFVRAFSARTAKNGVLAGDLKKLLGGDKASIRVNEIRFVAQDPALGDTGLAAMLAARLAEYDCLIAYSSCAS